jgi:threonine/homoserine/homoserine lactone efflux protein
VSPTVGRYPHNERVPTTSQWLAFVIASALFIQVPGPSLLFTIGRALTVGRRDALLSVVGNAIGVTTQVMLVAVGLGAVVAASTEAYVVLKVCGAAYVIWLGIQAIRHRADARAAMDAVDTTTVARASALRSLRVGFTVGLTNPKTIVFFVAFLPQFVNEPAGHTGLQLALLGVVFGAMAACSDSVWALAASRARDWFARRPTRLDKLGVAGGVMMIGLGATLAATE